MGLSTSLPWRLRSAIAGVALVVTFVGCPGEPSSPAANVTLENGVFEARGETTEAEYGTLEVPMRRGSPESGTIRLRFVRFKSRAPSPGSPIVYLAGGPGLAGIATARTPLFPLFMELRQVADVILLDQRGSGDSEPAGMSCKHDGLPLDEPGDPVRFATIRRRQVNACAATVAQQGVDLDGFTTLESADDLEDLRRALGAAKVTLLGVSYGSHLALATASRHPGSVDRLVLGGIEGPDQTLKLPSSVQTNLERLAEMVAADPVYSELMPDFIGTIRAVLERLEREPVTVGFGPSLRVTIGPWDLKLRISMAMANQSSLRQMPAMVYAMSKGEYYELAQWVHLFRSPAEVDVMALAMDCASYVTAERRERIRRETSETLLGAAINFPYPEVCDETPLPRLDESFRGPVNSDVPALLISGTLDGRTPLANAEEIAPGLSDHRHLVVENSDRSRLLTASPEILETMLAFLRGEEVATSRIELEPWTFPRPYEKYIGWELLDLLAADGYAAASEHYRERRQAYAGTNVYDFRENVLNRLGYMVLGAGDTEVAAQIFKLNTEAYPESFNAWDSLGEASAKTGEKELAIRSYEKSLALNPDNLGAARMLEQLRGEKGSTPSTERPQD